MTQTMPTPTIKPEDFITVKRLDYVIDKDGNQSIDNIDEKVHKELVDVMKVYTQLNTYINGMEISTVLKSVKAKRRTIIRYFAKRHKVKAGDVTMLLKAQTALTRVGNASISNLIWAIFWQPQSIKVGNYLSCVQFLKDMNIFEVLQEGTKNRIDANVEELLSYDMFKTIGYQEVREIEVGEYVFITDFNERTKRTITKRILVEEIQHKMDIGDTQCTINGYIYDYAKLNRRQL